MIEKAKKLEDMTESPKVENGPIVHSWFENQISGKLRFGSTESIKAIDEVRCSSALHYRQLARVPELETDDKYNHVTQFQRAFLIGDLHHTDILFKMQSVLSVRVMAWLLVTTTVENAKDVVTEILGVCDKSLQLKGALLTIQIFA